MKRYEDDGAEFLRTVLDGLRDKKHACEPCGSATDAWSFLVFGCILEMYTVQMYFIQQIYYNIHTHLLFHYIYIIIYIYIYISRSVYIYIYWGNCISIPS